MNKPTDKSILLTGFEPFGEHDVNPTEMIIGELDGEVINGYRVKGLVLPVVFGEAGDILINTIKEINPGAVLCLGLAAERTEISIERLAVNLDDAGIRDNTGNQPIDQVIESDGPEAYWSTLPVKEITSALKKEDIPVSLSMSAGTFVCNHVFYRLMHFLSAQNEIKGGFVHYPHFKNKKGTEPEANKLIPATRLIIEQIFDKGG